MSRNGELCLQKIIVSYSPNKGNPAMRQFMATYLPEFHRQYPQVKIDIRPRQWPESSITGVYRDGSEKAYSIRFLSSMGINVRFHRLVNEGNDYNHSFSASHLHMQRRSVQGVWNPYLWNYEGTRARHRPPAQWNRKLTEREWDYYIQQYGGQVKAEEETIADRVRRYTDIPESSTEEVQQRWKEHVMPRLQTDLEYNLSHWKKQHRAGAGRPAPPTLNEYSLFSVPDHSSLGQDAIDMLRRREAQREEDWWRERKRQLKPPE
ncbi:hypothetical protein LSCM4_03245 [Leishmania orientalis]|uniref:Large ribosomal subunit protein mL43 n=1 Tax=Leishmania orientalis TaxID=2249476 RepID=A0A836GXR4_9TRYP|nr:hypothetical protein LSCM4_03245 [Leishmania orientalis]